MKPSLHLLLRFIAVAFLLVPPFTSTAQTIDPDHKLLWKISGNGLPAPSYLYGTMHVQDKRAFGFSDSVLVKLQECSAFAMEVMPDSAVIYVLRAMLSPDTTGVDIFREYMTDDQYEQLERKLSEHGISLEGVNKTKAWMIESYLNTTDRNYKKDRPINVDSYLFRLARQFNKEIFPLEYVAEQLQDEFNAPPRQQVEKIVRMLDDRMMEHSAAMADSLLGFYSKGQLDSLLEMLSGEEGMDDQSMHELVTRNHTMVERLLPRLQKQSVFVAVGAAHLPGYEGLIELLRKRGYTVTPVTASFTGLADKVKLEPLTIPWYSFAPEGSGFSVDMPIEPVQMPMEDDDYTMYIIPDITTGVEYLVMHGVLPASVPESMIDQAVENMVESMADKDKTIEDLERISLQGVTGVSFIAQSNDDDDAYHIRMFMRGNRMYMFIAGMDTDEISPDIERFFSSIKFSELPRPQALSSDLRSEAGAFSIKFPIEPTLATKKIESDDAAVTMHLYTAETEEGVGYFAGYYEYGGNETLHQSLVLSESFNAMALNMNGELVSRTDTTWQGFPAADGLITSSTYTAHARMILRGNRPYIIMVIGAEDQLDQQETDDFFNSMHLLKFLPTEWEPYTSEAHGFTLQFPGDPAITSDTTDGVETTYIATDVHSGTNYSIIVDEFSDYREAKDEEEFFETFQKWYSHITDSIYTTQRFTVAGYPAMEFTRGDSADHRRTRVRGILCGQRLYTLILKEPASDLSGKNAEHFFHSFIVVPTSSPDAAKTSLFDDGTAALFRDLASQDSDVQERARRAIQAHEFTAADLPEIYKVVSHPYGDDSLHFTSTRARLVESIETIADSTTPVALRAAFPSMKTSAGAQREVFSLLASMDTEQSLSVLTELCTGPDVADDMTLPFYTLSTTTANCRVMFPGILSIIGNDDMRSALYAFINRALDSSITLKEIAPAYSDIFRLCRQDYAKLQAPLEEDEYGLYYRYYGLKNTIRILGHIGNDSAVALLNMLVADTSSSLVMEASLALTRSNRTVASDRWELVAADPLVRGNLYQELEKLDRTSLFPQAYYSQQSFAEADFLNLVVNLYEEPMPKKIELMEEYEIEEGEQAGRYFLFKFLQVQETDEGEQVEKWYVGVSGPQPLDKGRVAVSGEMTASNYDEVDAMSAEEHFTALLNQ